MLTGCGVYCGLITSTGFCSQSSWNIKNLLFKVVGKEENHNCCATVYSLFGSIVVTLVDKVGAEKTLTCYKIIITKVNNHKYQMDLHNVPFDVSCGWICKGKKNYRGKKSVKIKHWIN